MAMKRAALLEKRLRRERETQLRKQQLEAEMEHRKEETRWGRRAGRASCRPRAGRRALGETFAEAVLIWGAS